MIRDDYCPICYEITSYEITGKMENLAIYPFCKKCGWKGTWDDVLDEQEVKNYKRTKMIDNMLNETI